jgi:hypothetical protein
MAGDQILERLFRKYGTDKVAYASAYEIFLRSRRQQVATLLEVGIGTLLPDAHSNMIGWAAPHYRPGGSLRSWRDYFPRARIIGIDVQPDTQFSDERISTYLCDSTDEAAVNRLIAKLDLHDIDVVIDDGSHEAVNQLATLQNFFHFLGSKGLYVIEDIAGNGIFNFKEQILEKIGNSVLLTFGTEFDVIFVQKIG